MAAPRQQTIKLHKHQDEALFAEERFVAIISGIQGGKTTAGALFARMQFDQFPQDDGLICAPTYKILQQSTLPKFFALNPDLQEYFKKGDSVIDVPGRGKIYVRSTENPNVLEGMTLRWAWPDEAGQMKVDAWINLQGRVSIKQGKIFITTTWYNLGWLYTDFYNKWKQGIPNYKVVTFRSVDSPYFPKEEYERAKATMDPRVFARRYEGLPTKMEGLVYEDFNYNYHVTDNVPTEFDVVFGGIDWGYEAPAAIVIIGVHDDTFYLLDEFYGNHKTTPELIEIARGFKERYKVTRWYADSAEPDRIEEFKRASLYTLESNKDMEWGLNKVRQLLREERLRFHSRNKFLLDEIERYHYPPGEDGKPTKESPEKVDDHAMDAMRYALATYQPRPKPSGPAIVRRASNRARIPNRISGY